MKRLSLLIVFCALALLLNDSLANAQPPGARFGQGGGPGGRGQGMGGPNSQGRGQQTPPLLRIFDADGDGELSAMEIDAATVALRKLDQNRDGKLTAEELRPSGAGQQPNRQGQSRGGPRGAMQGGGRPGGGGPSGGGPSGGERPGGGGGRGGDPAQADAEFAEQLMAFDEDQDGSLDKSELPEHMQKAFAIADANKDGKLDRAERLVLASQFRRNQLNPTGDAPLNKPTQGRRP
ncbi:EF hand [Novipirellula galeiformis]|uniref:EF hand n=1 Tax=Novipirellula galeiformis TaxID=2528004 RepID=A0A5C6CF38_9BACT|nr:hypothetical protein [Novipirellula galeiformis]TWU23503.1 EF hand [Novipirellula galeiformis]